MYKRNVISYICLFVCSSSHVTFPNIQKLGKKSPKTFTESLGKGLWHSWCKYIDHLFVHYCNYQTPRLNTLEYVFPLIPIYDYMKFFWFKSNYSKNQNKILIFALLYKVEAMSNCEINCLH